MKLHLPRPVKRIPPLILLLIVYMLASSLYWVFYSSSVPLFHALLWSMIFVGGMALVYSQISHFFFIFILITTLCALIRNHQITSYFNTFPFEQTAMGVKADAVVCAASFQPTNRFPFCYTLALHTITSKEETHSVSYLVLLYTRKKLTVQVGDNVTIPSLSLKKPNNDSFYFYLMKEGIAATSFQETVSLSITSHPTYSLTRWFFEKREELIHLFQQNLNSQTFGLFAAMFLGEKELIKKNKETREEPFKKWGIVHYLARSGLHLVILVSLCEFILRCVPLTFIVKQFFVLLTVLCYFLLTWPSVSFMRAFLIFLLYKLCALTRTPSHFLHFLILCCLSLLLINPLYMFFLDFQLSFGLTFALAWLNLFRTTSLKEN